MRDILAFRHFANGSLLRIDGGLLAQSQRWLLLQLRQIYRQALESLLAWVERMLTIDDDRFHLETPSNLWQRAGDELASSQAGFLRCGTVAEAVARCLPRSCVSFETYASWLRSEDEPSIIQQAYDLADATSACEQTVADCLALLIRVERMLLWIDPDSFLGRELGFHSAPHRVPFSQWRAAVQRCRNRPPSELLEFILKQLVLSQHFAVATQRHEAGKPRLRIAVEEEGFRPLIDFPWTPRPTPDRLDAMLSLMRSCGLIRKHGDLYSA